MCSYNKETRISCIQIESKKRFYAYDIRVGLIPSNI